MKYVVVVFALMFVSCVSRMENASISDCGKKEIGKGLYLKKIEVNSDRVSLLVDENDKLVSSNTATSYTVYTQEGKTTQTRVMTNSLISQ